MLSDNESEVTLPLLVRELNTESDGVLSVTLAHSDGSALPAWQPGAHIDVEVGPARIRQYSLSGNPADRGSYRITVLREPAGRGGSAWVHDQVRLGDSITVRGPRNQFALDAAADYVFVAGGIGITPILPMIQSVEGVGRPWRLLYGGRSAASMAFIDELRQFGDHVEFYDQSTSGLIPLESITAGPGTLVYACGPEPLLSACENRAQAWPASCLRLERFGARREAHAAGDHAFDVTLARSEITIRVAAKQTILDALETAGLSTMSSCEEGLCGTCEVAVLSGEIDHRDEVLSREERACGKQMMICVSRARGTELILDL